MEVVTGASLGERFRFMDEEIAAKQILFDVELITLIALATGLIFYGVARFLRRRDGVSTGGGFPGDFDGFDLVLMFFPAMLFLLNPIVEGLTAEAGKPAAEDPVGDEGHGILSPLVNLGYFAFVGIMTYGLLAWVRNRPVVELFGLRRLGLAKIIVISILGGVFSLLLCGWIVGDFSSSYLEGVFGELELQEPVKMLRESKSVPHLAASIALACVAAPLVEELLFRGYMYGTLRRLTHPVFAAVILGGLFAVVHSNLPALLPLWVFSLILCLAYEITRCLWVPVGMHVFFNAANIVLMMMPETVE